ncbi:transcriptional regulator, RpiR family [Propionispira arboris]|uniref:Transcriptional regulator, RpiR family n=1 Tax=Propionispira arboris TaxID=84035 RepID=A0A1H7D558_9FIRM|nr:MurR/RpiR family transcriptional regulator [Propionispira arboris]SEJ96949.1 transcriptional regulator, RpiR family [Propionispira arboris]
MNIIKQLAKPKFKVSKSDKILMEYIKQNIERVSHTAISQLAKECGIGESTITRFVKKMGFSTLPDFKVALAQELMFVNQRYIINRNIESDETALVTARKLLDANIGTLEKTLNSLKNEDIQVSAELLMTARRIYFIGIGNSGFMAQDSAYKFFRIGLDCTSYDNSHQMIMMASLVQDKDIVVAISHSGNTIEVIKTVELAKTNGAKIIAITSNQHSQLQAIADLHLAYAARETLLETGSISAKLAQLFLMDLVYTQVVKQMPAVAEKKKCLTTQAIELLR